MQHDVVGNDRILALPGWKRLLWHDISLAAKLKDAFDASDYDSTGDLNADSPKLEQLYTWLVSRRTEAQFKSIRPAWRHFAHSNWELTFLAVWTEATQSAGTKKHIYRKTTGIMVEGRDPTDSISEEWVLVHSEEIPGHGEEGAESEEYCDML